MRSTGFGVCDGDGVGVGFVAGLAGAVVAVWVGTGVGDALDPGAAVLRGRDSWLAADTSTDPRSKAEKKQITRSAL